MPLFQLKHSKKKSSNLAKRKYLERYKNKTPVIPLLINLVYILFIQVFLATSSIHEMLNSELTNLGILSVEATNYTKWEEKNMQKILLPGGMFKYIVKLLTSFICHFVSNDERWRKNTQSLNLIKSLKDWPGCVVAHLQAEDLSSSTQSPLFSGTAFVDDLFDKLSD